MCGASFVTGLFLQRTAGLLAYRLLFATRVCLSLRLFEKELATNFWRLFRVIVDSIFAISGQWS
jgi:hypothetical protein